MNSKQTAHLVLCFPNCGLFEVKLHFSHFPHLLNEFRHLADTHVCTHVVVWFEFSLSILRVNWLNKIYIFCNTMFLEG